MKFFVTIDLSPKKQQWLPLETPVGNGLLLDFVETVSQQLLANQSLTCPLEKKGKSLLGIFFSHQKFLGYGGN